MLKKLIERGVNCHAEKSVSDFEVFPTATKMRKTCRALCRFQRRNDEQHLLVSSALCVIENGEIEDDREGKSGEFALPSDYM